MGYEVRTYKLTSADCTIINGARSPNYFPRVSPGDEHPMIVMGKVILDGETFHWVDPNAKEPAPAVAPAPVVPAAPMVVASSAPVVPTTAGSAAVTPSPVTLTAEQHALLTAAGVPVAK